MFADGNTMKIDDRTWFKTGNTTSPRRGELESVAIPNVLT